jgi:hypothetical protein
VAHNEADHQGDVYIEGHAREMIGRRVKWLVFLHFFNHGNSPCRLRFARVLGAVFSSSFWQQRVDAQSLMCVRPFRILASNFVLTLVSLR